MPTELRVNLLDDFHFADATVIVWIRFLAGACSLGNEFQRHDQTACFALRNCKLDSKSNLKSNHKNSNLDK